MVNATFNKFGKKLPPVKTGQRFGEEVKKDKKVGLFSERRFLIFTYRNCVQTSSLHQLINNYYCWFN